MRKFMMMCMAALFLPVFPGAVKGGVGLELHSRVFQEGGPIPAQYTCEGADISPPLAWSDIPEQAKSLAIICDDPDAPMGNWVHWVCYDIPATTHSLPAHIPAGEIIPDGGKQGLNDFKKLGYGGPCPPRGVHRYYFRLYVLDSMLDLPSGLTKAQLQRAMQGHILTETHLMGTYAR